MENKYASERVINISELEGIIQSAYLISEALSKECQFENCLATEKVKTMAEDIKDELKKALEFEFCVERRTTVSSRP